MKRREFAQLALLGAVPSVLSFAAQANSGYATLKQPASVLAPKGQIEVVQSFSYACSHCKNFDPVFEAWRKTAAKDVSVRLVHVGFNKNFEPLQRIYYALESLGQAQALNGKVFKAFQDEKKRLDQPEVLFPWVAEQGVDRAKFEAAYQSFSVATQVRQAIQLQDQYQVEGTPAMGIAGRYYTDGSMAGGFERMIQITNQLIEQERKRT